MSKANIETLNTIHDLLAGHYIAKLQSGEISPAELTAVNNFLKQNDISADVVESKPMMSLVEEMKDKGDAEELLSDVLHFG
jgi:ABC-type Zn uptake system ZnuABC Zn-binding protein ZnuA